MDWRNLRSRWFFLTLLAALGLAGCAPLALPPTDATARNATALAELNGMLTQTRQAVPRKLRQTPLPPPVTPPGINFQGTQFLGGHTNTPAPATLPPATETPAAAVPLPVTGATAAPLPAASATGVAGIVPTSDCNHALDVAAAGPKVRVVIKNDSNGEMTLSIALGHANSRGQCGYMSWPPVPKLSKVVVEAPQSRPDLGDSCYWAVAVIRNGKGQSTVTGNGFCLKPSQRWVFDVSNNRITLSSK